MTAHPGLGPPPAASWIGRTLRNALESAPVAMHPDWVVLDAGQVRSHGITLNDDEAGLLMPGRGYGRGYGIDADGVELFKALRQPVMLDLSEESPVTVRRLARLISEGVLMFDASRRNPGTDAPTGWAALLDRLPLLADASGTDSPCRNIRLSAKALAYACDWRAALGDDLQDALYDYGRTPTRLPSPAGHRMMVAAADAVSSVERYGGTGPWVSWRSRDPALRRGTGGPKLFVSPADPVEGLCAAFPALEGLSLAGLKFPAATSAFARPDTCVIYLADAEGLRRAVDALAPALSGIKGRGLPFAAPLDMTGLLSWGVDPPAPEDGGPDVPQSHRMHVACRAAAHIAATAAAALGDEAAQQDEVAWRLALDGYADHGCAPLDGLAHAG